MQITIHGDNGSGKSTLAKALAQKINYKHFSTGDYARALAEKQGFESIKEYMADMRTKNLTFDIDNLIDSKLQEELRLYENIVVDSRLGYFFAKQSIKIYCMIDPSIAAKWIWEGDKRKAEQRISVEEIRTSLIERKENDRLTYLAKYGTDYTDMTHFDDVILSFQFQNQQERMVEEALRIIEKINTKRNVMQ